MGPIGLEQRETIQSDVLVIGGGLAGIMAAIEARKLGADVLLVSKSRVGFGNNSAVALGGIAATAGTGWRDPADRYEDHVRDTLEAGRYVNDRKLVEAMVPEIEAAIRAIETYGVRFKKRGESFSVSQVPGHSYPRTIVPEEGAGTSITKPMRDHALSLGVRHFEGTVITRLLQDGKVATGAFGVDSTGRTTAFQAGAIILAAGGMGRLYLFGDNPPDATGDGYALAYDAGLTLRDMEFVQFVPGTPTYEIWVGRHGATIRNRAGEDVLAKHGLTDLKSKTRDAVSRAAYLELTAGLGVDGKFLTLDASNIPDSNWEKLQSFLPARLRGIGRNLPMNPPEAHFFMGGVAIDECTATGLQGLYACGEICGGVHGANRLGSNALSECLVFGARAGRQAAEWARSADRRDVQSDTLAAELARLDNLASGKGSATAAMLAQELRNIMWAKVGIVRSGTGLQQAIAEIGNIGERLKEVPVEDAKELLTLHSLHSMVELANLIARAALARTESRGAHYRTDFPAENDKDWLANLSLRKDPTDSIPILQKG